MKTFVFLYPVTKFVAACVEQSSLFREGRHSPWELNRLIGIRYRERGYQIAWIVFSRYGQGSCPEWNWIAGEFDFRGQDRVIPCGIPLEAMVSKRQYPHWGRILTAIGRPELLVIGGFHQFDCVDRLARAAHRHSLRVFVDEDLTELFFAHTHLEGYPPCDDFSFSAQTAMRDTNLLAHHRRIRSARPWLLQVGGAIPQLG